MLVKICGITNAENLRSIAALKPDYIGCIFYAKSPRYISITDAEALLSVLPANIKAVGVFVNEEVQALASAASKLNFSALQLHGDGVFETARKLRAYGFTGEIFGAVPATADALSKIPDDHACSMLLFDTPTAAHGGSGQTFDWSLINHYAGNTPFLLSGGIGPDTIDDALTIKDKRCVGFDLNSKLESAPGVKDIEKTEFCIRKVRHAAR